MCDTVISGHETSDGVHLILHQGYQRRYHDGRTLHHESRQLIAERFSAAGRHQDKGIAAGNKMRYYLFLITFERVETEEFL